jgi:transposase
MPKTRTEFSPEFKREAVALLEGSGRPLMQVATEVGISPSMLRNWRAVVRGGTVRSRSTTSTVSPMPSPADQASEITRLKRELDRTRMERDVLIMRSASSRRCRDELPIHPRPCRQMADPADVSGPRGLASGYYAWRNRPDSARVVANRALLTDVRRLHGEHHGRYGSPRMRHSAPKAGRRVVAASRG